MEEADKEKNDSLSDPQHNDKPQLSGKRMRFKQPPRYQQLDAADSERKNVAKYKMGVQEGDENAGGPSTSEAGAKRNETSSNIRSRSRRYSQHTESESEEDSSEPKGKVAASKSKVNC